MTSNLDLFVREPVTLAGFVPPLTREKTLLGYEFNTYKPGRGLGWTDDEPEEQKQWSITVEGQKFAGRMNYYSGDALDISHQIAAELLATPENLVKNNPAYKWLKENKKDLAISFRYWKAIKRITEIKQAEERIQNLQRDVRIGKILSSLDAIQVLEGRKYSMEESHRACREFGMTEEEIKIAYQYN